MGNMVLVTCVQNVGKDLILQTKENDIRKIADLSDALLQITVRTCLSLGFLLLSDFDAFKSCFCTLDVTYKITIVHCLVSNNCHDICC